MNINFPKYLLLVLVFLTVLFAQPVFCEELVRAKIGVEVVDGGISRLASSRDVLTPDNQFRILIIPDEEAYVYLIHSDFDKASLIFTNANQKKLVPNEVTLIPPKGVYYQLDGTAEVESLYILCADESLSSVDGMFGNETVPHPDWESLYKDLKKKSKIKISNKSEKPAQIGGNLRGGKGDSLVAELRTYAGNSLLTKDYRFNVKK